MKILILLLLLTLGVNANEVVYGSKHGEFTEPSDDILYTNSFLSLNYGKAKSLRLWEQVVLLVGRQVTV